MAIDRRVKHLRYDFADSPLGLLLLAATEAGVCALLPGEQEEALLADLGRRFPAAEQVRDRAGLAGWTNEILRGLEQPDRPCPVPLDPHGSAFELRVWQALGAIAPGLTLSYGELAATLGSHPRAVARACASNPLAVLIPCHRVVSADGALRGYRWGLTRKQALLAGESTAAAH